MNSQITRALAVGAIPVAIIAIAFVILRGGSSYEIHAHFVDAGQLVEGGLVEVGGNRIGSVKEIKLTDNNQADVVLKIKDDEYDPLHRGTTAQIRTVGLSGVANRYVEISPGPKSQPEIPDGGELPSTATRPVIDLDVLLNELDKPTRDRLQSIIKDGSKIFAGATAETNAALHYLNPALAQFASLSSELARDQVAVEQLISSGAKVSGALASRRGDVEQGITNTAATLRAVASERAALQDALARAPRVLNQANNTFRGVRSTLTAALPAIDELRPVAAPLARVLRQIVPVSQRTTPVIRELRGQLKPLRRVLLQLKPLAEASAYPLRSTTRALEKSLPIFAGLRPYTQDLFGGLTVGFGGGQGGSYDANGHYARVSAHLSPDSGIVGLKALLPVPPTTPGFFTKGVKRCPGGAGGTAADGSTPYIEPGNSYCDPAQTIP